MSRKGSKAKVDKKQSQRRKRPTQEEIRERYWNHRDEHEKLRQRELAEHMARMTKGATPNRKVEYATPEEEAAERERLAGAFIDATRPQLSGLLASLAKIPDFRDPKKIQHKMTMVLFYGILCFVLQMTSRRAANREMTGPVLLAHLKAFFPELETLPHHDSVNRILSRIDVEQIQDTHLQMIQRLIRNKKFNRYLHDGRYPIAVDGTQKLVSSRLMSPAWLERTLNKGTEHERKQYYVYTLEAVLVFSNGLTLPLMTEILNYEQGDTANDKQDCETRAFHRLAKRLKKEFRNLRIQLLLDGLYPQGPVFAICRKYHWDFMIVLQDASLPTVWEEFHGLSRAEPHQADRIWGNRHQHFQWANAIEYAYGENGKKRQKIHVVVCTEDWKEIDPETSMVVEKTARHAWISDQPLTKDNLHVRCNLAARHRWGIEEGFLVEKHHGYQYEHLFSQNWEAMKGYHYLMHIARALNVLAQFSEALCETVKQMGVRNFIKFIRDTFLHPWVAPERLKEGLSPTPQLRLI